MNKRAIWAVAAAPLCAVVTMAAVGSGGVSAGDTDHTIVVDGTAYSSYKESGAAWHFNTPHSNPTSASVAERQQTWTGHGSEHLPCANGIHWISNSNVLTISHCLEGTDTTEPPQTTEPPETTAPETTQPETTISVTTEPETTLAQTTAPPTTATATTAVAQTSPPTAVAGVFGTAPPDPVTTPPQVLGASSPDPEQALPTTGWNNMAASFIAALLLLLGGAAIAVSRRSGPQTTD